MNGNWLIVFVGLFVAGLVGLFLYGWRACQIVGGVEALAARLRVPVPTMFRWLDGEAEPPTPVFLKAVDIVMPNWTPEDEILASAVRATRPKKPLA